MYMYMHMDILCVHYIQYSSEATWQTHACHTRVTRTVLASGCACTRARVREYNVIISLQAWPNVPIKEH